MGFSVILVDPEPGYHPKTIGKSDDEKLNCLIKVYEDFGLKRVMCQIPKAIVEVYGEDVNIQDARKSIYGKHVPLAYDRTVMIGDIDEMLGNINGLIFNFFYMIGIEKTVAINNAKTIYSSLMKFNSNTKFKAKADEMLVKIDKDLQQFSK
jgi:hypothetical protein